MRGQQGISLTEIMVSLFLTSLFITASMQHYLNSKQYYMQTQILLEHALELQLVDDLIRDSVRRAGFTPCIGINSLKTLDRRYVDKTPLTAITVNAGKRHALHINRMSEYFNTVLKIISPNKILVTADKHNLREQTILIADCYHAEVQKILSTQQANGQMIVNLASPLVFNYVAPIYWGEWVEEAFFIQANTQGNLALFYRRNHAEELTPIVNSMSANLKSNQEKWLLQLTLGLDNAQSIVIETRVRAA